MMIIHIEQAFPTRPRLLALLVLASLTGSLHAQSASLSSADPYLSEKGAGQGSSYTSTLPIMIAATQTEPAPTHPFFATPRKKSAKNADAPPTYIEADKIDGRTDMEVRASGKARLQREDVELFGNTLTLDQTSNVVTAEGAVKMIRYKDWVYAPRAKINLDTYFGEFDAPEYSIERPVKEESVQQLGSGVVATGKKQKTITANGHAEILKLEGENQYRLTNATYSTCEAPKPDWYLKVKDLEIDYDREQGTGHHVTMIFGGVPVMYTPWTSFPLNGGRQSGFLPPSVGTMSNTGIDITLPYYFNIAPNYDATIEPRLMSKRGIQFDGEFRYLTPSYNGKLMAEYMPNDREKGSSRSLIQILHDQNFGNGFSGHLDYGKVSDAEYFADLSSRITSTSQSTLNQQAALYYSNSTWLSSSLNFQRYQTIAGEEPYNRLPQFQAIATLPDVYGFSFLTPLELTSFDHSTKDTGIRATIYPQLSYPVEVPQGFITPKIGIHLSHYDIKRTETVGGSSLSRAVPIMSLDMGLNFEREVSLLSKKHTQTLEPRLYYLRVPYRNQDDIPVFDTALADFNFTQLFSENRYSGYDRIGDANQLTAAVTSRFIENSSGIEWLRASLGQRYYFNSQRVTLPGESPRQSSMADILAGVSGRVSKDVWLDTTYQYNPREEQTEYAVATLRYQPGFAKVITTSYRYKQGADGIGFRDFDVAAQWPLSRQWYFVGRINRNLKDHQLSQAIAGFEYKAGCWAVRFAWQTLYNTSKSRNNGIFLQFEFNGLASVGMGSTVELLKRNITGYGNIDQSSEMSISDPVFGGASY